MSIVYKCSFGFTHLFAVGVFLLFIPTPRCSRAVLAATLVHPAPPIPATSLTGRARAASRSSCGYQHGLHLVHIAAELDQHRPVLVMGRDHVFIRSCLFGWWLAIWHPIWIIGERSARVASARLCL